MNQNPSPPSPEEEDRPAYTPASVEKRIAAWVGLAYALWATAAITVMLFTGSVDLFHGTAALLLLPAGVGMCAGEIYRLRKDRTSSRFLSALGVGFGVAAALFGLTGIPVLIANIMA